MTYVEVINLDSSDTEDEDFVPGGEPNDLSEEEDNDDAKTGSQQSGKTNGKNKKKKKGVNNKKAGPRPTKRKTKAKGDDSEEDSDDNEADVDFVVDEKSLNKGEEVEVTEDPEEIAAREKKEKERIDMLYADFLSSVEAMMNSKKKKNGTSNEKTVTKVYDFAGERVEVQERVKVSSPPEDSKTRSSGSSTISSFAGESSTSGEGSSKRVMKGGCSVSLNGIAPIPNKPPPPKRLRVSFLSGDPADIGLTGDKKMSAKERLANVLNAMKARSKKLGTLDKSKLDWEAYKRDQGLQEELDSHTRSRHGYIDKQEFLQRADLRQFEREKEARAKRRRNNI